MRVWSLSLTALVVCIMCAPLTAEDQGAKKGRRGDKAGPGGGRFQEILKRFDKDGDGKLNEEERAAARKAREEFAKKRGEAGKGDGKGRPGGPPNKEELLKRFDKNGNGEIDADEREAAKKFFAQQGGGKGRPGINREEILKRFDKNGNGQIDEDERDAVRKFIMEQRGGKGDGRFQEIIKRFDKDGDGKLNDEEKAAARKFMQENAGKGDRPGRDGKGRPGAEGSADGGKSRLKQDILKKFDKDGDGELNAEERKAARAARDASDRPKSSE